nr:hypothetical protein [Roseomonas sp. HF4]
MADEFDLRRIIGVLAGADDHLVDQRTCCLQHLRRVAALDGLSQRGNPPGVEFGKVRVQGRCGSRLLLEGGEQLLLPCFQLLELALHPWRAHPFGDGLDEVLEPPVHRLKLPPASLGRGGRFGLGRVPLLDEGLAERRQVVWAHQPRPKRFHHHRLEFGTPHAPGIGAAAAVPHRRAGEVVLAHRAEPVAADAADHLPGQQVARPPPIPERHVTIIPDGSRLVGETSLRPLPEGVVDDPQRGDGDLDDLFLRAGTDNPRSGDRVAQPRVAVPAQQTGVGRIAEDAIAPPRPPSDAGVIPGGAGRAGNAICVQGSGNRSRAAALDKFGKNPPHDRRFGRLDLTQAALRLAVSAEAAQRAIAIGRPAAGATLADASLLAAMGLLGEVPQVQGTHGAPDADMQLRDLALAEGHDLHLLERGLLVEGRDMLEVARETVEALREDEVDLAATDVRQKGLVAGPDKRRAGDGRIRVGAGDGPALALRTRRA